jgi:uncharacterized OB-fold protein
LPTPLTQPFWDGLRERRLLLQYSPSTQQWVFYPRLLAPRTLADDLEWREASGLGTLYTFTIARYPTWAAWSDDVPQLIGVVQLAEGPRLTTELVGIAPQDLHVGMPVRAVFREEQGAGVTMLRFTHV